MLNRNLFLLTCGGGKQSTGACLAYQSVLPAHVSSQSFTPQRGRKKEEKRSEGQITSE